jgi:alkanesulfonate monooxygenase SsuD/methylene tetrahydromethanopterin reductase-like flavin-dependent oxidoreductase (luciferase family)
MRAFPLRVGVVILPDEPWARARDRWMLAEQLGFDHAWTYDHLTWRSHRDHAWFAAVPTLTAAAVVTARIRLGPLVASPNFRHPLTLAKDMIALDDISGGRVTLGVGAGGTGWDATMLGQDPWDASERADRFAEFVQLTDMLLRSPRVTFRGRFYSVDEARTYPGCTQEPRLPLALAATGRRGMAIAATVADTWVTTGARRDPASSTLDHDVDSVRAQIDTLVAACNDAGRDPTSLARLVLTGVPLRSGLESVDAFTDVAARYADAGVTDLVVHMPRPTDPYRGDMAVFERIFSD